MKRIFKEIILTITLLFIGNLHAAGALPVDVPSGPGALSVVVPAAPSGPGALSVVVPAAPSGPGALSLVVPAAPSGLFPMLRGTVLAEEVLNDLYTKAKFLEAQLREARATHLPASSSMPHIALSIIDCGVAKEKEKGKTLAHIIGASTLLPALVETSSVLRGAPEDKDVLKRVLIKLAFAAGEFDCLTSRNAHLSYTKFDALPAEDPRFEELSLALLSAFDSLFS